MRRSVVDLPQPDGPSSTLSVPASNANETSSTARTGPVGGRPVLADVLSGDRRHLESDPALRRHRRRPDQPNSAVSAAPGSGARMNASPTRNALTPCRRICATSRCARMPLSVTTRRSGGTRGRSSSVVSQRHVERAQVAVVDADQRRRQPQRAIELRRIVHFDQHVHAVVDARRLRAPRAARRRARRRSAGSRRRRARATRRPGTRR